MLEVRGLAAGYGSAQVLFGVDLSVGAGEVVTLLGRNGMGKTTTVHAVAGVLRPSAGSIRLHGRELAGAPSHRIGRAGLGLVPEGRQVFPTLTVEENLRATARPGGAWDLGRVLALFPALAERRRHLGTHLSGGEQQMLAIGRALMTNPGLVVLDEATEGLAPVVRAGIWRCLARLKADGLAILLIDKNVEALARLADRHVVLERGRVAWTGTSAALEREAAAVARYLEV
jgi:branched-chain amino acid transport system ATP-binding protein